MKKRTIVRVALLTTSAIVGSLLGGAMAARPAKSRSKAQPRLRAAAGANKGAVWNLDPPGMLAMMQAKHDERVQEFFQYKGHFIGRREDANVDEALRDEIAKAFQRADPVHPARIARWKRLFDNEPNYFHRGWEGVILSVQNVPGGMEVTLQMRPSIADRRGGDTKCLEFWIEHFFYNPADGSLRFLDAEEDRTGESRSLVLTL